MVLDRLLSRAVSSERVPSRSLLLVEDIIRAHGGTMEIETDTDDPDHGTCVTLRLPAGLAPARADCGHASDRSDPKPR